jgi:RNA 2',3'-cyclic 3'-phosphodiesterase
MRLFAAIPLPEDAHRTVADCLRSLREEGWPVRWVHDEGLHLTLKFFGEVTSGRLDTIVEMLGFCVQQVRPMTLAVRGAGVFPVPSRPRVIKLDVDAPSDLELLQDRIERGGEGIGFPPEGRPFAPHITLGRVREGHRLPPGALDSLDRVAPQPPFVADRLVLFESELTPGGPRYQARAEFLFQ